MDSLVEKDLLQLFRLVSWQCISPKKALELYKEKVKLAFTLPHLYQSGSPEEFEERIKEEIKKLDKTLDEEVQTVL